jgi:DNA oxidative demethylase
MLQLKLWQQTIGTAGGIELFVFFIPPFLHGFLRVPDMPDLFNDTPIPGLRLQADFISAAEELELITCIDAQALAPFRFQQWTGKRLVKSFGWHYDFQHGSVSRAEPLPGWLLPLRERAARFASLAPDELQQALLLKYEPGAGINWHKDRPVFEHVLGISLGAHVDMRFRRKAEGRWQRAVVALPARSLYQLAGEVRYEWEHSIVEMAEGTRYSITFRSLSESGLKVTTRL